MDFSEAVILNIAAIVFAAGILYSKVSAVEKKVDKIDSHSEKIAQHEARINNLEKQL